MIYHSTEIEFQQAALDYISRTVSERASSVIATGNVADIGEECLEYLYFIGLDKQLNVFSVGVYLDIIKGENEEINRFFD